LAETSYDVVVVGGGPAGAAAAKAAVAGGLETVLLEAKRIPRPKPCSGYLFAEALAVLDEHYGPMPDTVRANPHRISGVRVRLPGDTLLDVPIGGANIWRDRFDAWLCAESGAEILDGTRLVDFAEWRDRVELVCRRGGSEMTLEARVLIAAVGCFSMVPLRLDPGFLDGVPFVRTLQQYFRSEISLEPGYLHVFVSPEYGAYPAAYVKDDLVVLDSSVRPGKSLQSARLAFQAMLAREQGFRPVEPELRLGCKVAFPSALNRFCLGTDRVLVVGEAAGFANSMGEGISSALVTGYIAGSAAAECGASAPGPAYRERVRPERERTAKEWMLPAVMTGRARPELRDTLFKLSPLTMLKVTRGILAWQNSGGVVPTLQKHSIEVMIRRLLNGDFDFRS
jgi:flavin-dependent dehydrogenase